MNKQLILLAFLSVSLCAYAQDWPNLKRYQEANEKLKDSTVNAVFMGDSITDFWIENDSTFFKHNHYADRGISAQTSPQMLLRFRQDVVSLHPKAVVILSGTNDIAGNTGPSTLEMIEDNIQSMAELAKVHQIKVVLGAVMPVTNAKGGRPADKIIALNAWIKAYAGKNRFIYVDYYTPMVDPQLSLKEEYTQDGLHPNKEGYQVMENLVQAAIRKVL